jgi:tRNA (cmo5U34)-methyltransferase
MSRFPWEPDAQLEAMRAEVPRELVAACAGVDAQTILLLGPGDAYVPPRFSVALRVRALEAPQPRGPFDLVVCEHAARSLAPSARAELFVRVAACVRPGGRFALVTGEAVGAQVRALAAAGFDARATWSDGDLAVLAADRR